MSPLHNEGWLQLIPIPSYIFALDVHYIIRLPVIHLMSCSIIACPLQSCTRNKAPNSNSAISKCFNSFCLILIVLAVHSMRLLTNLFMVWLNMVKNHTIFYRSEIYGPSAKRGAWNNFRWHAK